MIFGMKLFLSLDQPRNALLQREMLRLEPFDLNKLKNVKNSIMHMPFWMQPPVFPVKSCSDKTSRKALLFAVCLLVFKLMAELKGVLNNTGAAYFGELMQVFYPASLTFEQEVHVHGCVKKVNVGVLEIIPQDTALFEDERRAFKIKHYPEYEPFLISNLEIMPKTPSTFLDVCVLYIPNTSIVRPMIDTSLIESLLNGLSIISNGFTPQAIISKDVHRDPIALRNLLLSHKVCFKALHDSSLLRPNYHHKLTDDLLAKIQRIADEHLVGTWFCHEALNLRLEHAMQLFFPLCRVTEQQGAGIHLDYFEKAKFLHLNSSKEDVNIESFIQINQFIISHESHTRRTRPSLEERRLALRETLLRHFGFNEFDRERFIIDRYILKADIQQVHASNSIIDPGMVLGFNSELLYYTTMPILVRKTSEGYIKIFTARLIDEAFLEMEYFIFVKAKKRHST